MRRGINFMLGLILGFLLAAFITSSFSCETQQCRADRGHNGEGAFVGLAVSTILDRHNGPDKKVITFAETLVVSAVISVATEWFVGRHGRGFSNKDAFERWGGGAAGAATYQILTLEYKF